MFTNFGFTRTKYLPRSGLGLMRKRYSPSRSLLVCLTLPVPFLLRTTIRPRRHLARGLLTLPKNLILCFGLTVLSVTLKETRVLIGWVEAVLTFTNTIDPTSAAMTTAATIQRNGRTRAVVNRPPQITGT